MKSKHHLIPIILAIALMLANSPSPSILRDTLGGIISPLYYLTDIPTQLYYWIKEQGQDKNTLNAQLQALTHENTKLKADLQTYNATLVELKNLNKILNANYRIEPKNTILAALSNAAISRFSKQFIVNKGTKDGIQVGYAVVGAQGVIGKITQVQANFSTVLTLVDPVHHIPLKSIRNGFHAIAQGVASYDNKLQLKFVPKNSDIKLGDIFVTSGLGGIFPKNHPVGTITHLDNTGNTFMLIELAPVEHINQIEFMLIITHEK